MKRTNKKIKRARTGGGPIFFFKEGFKNILVNGFMSFAATSVIAICIIIIGCMALATLNVREEIKKEVDDSQILIFIESTFEEDYEIIEKQIKNINTITNFEYTSKEEALENYKLQLGDEAVALEGLENDNPLRDGYIIYLDNLDEINNVTESLSNIDGIANVSSKNDTLTALNNVQKGFDLASIILFLIFMGLSIFIISNTVKLALYARQDEIAIMKMIGATDAFVRWPFIFEGLILGIVASLVAYCGIFAIYHEFITFAGEFIGFFDIISFDSVSRYVLIGCLSIGSVIGVSGSIFTIRKFLKV